MSKHLRNPLVQCFRSIESKMNDGEVAQALTIRDLCGLFKKQRPNEECPSDMQIRMAADVVFKRNGYHKNCTVWVTKLSYYMSRCAKLEKENRRLNDMVYDKSHAGRILRSA